MENEKLFPKYKIAVKDEIKNDIDILAEKLGLYEPKLGEQDQCSGYFAFRRACLRKEPPPEGPFKESGLAVECTDADFKLLHVNLRTTARICVKYVRKKYGISKENK